MLYVLRRHLLVCPRFYHRLSLQARGALVLKWVGDLLVSRVVCSRIYDIWLIVIDIILCFIDLFFFILASLLTNIWLKFIGLFGFEKCMNAREFWWLVNIYGISNWTEASTFIRFKCLVDYTWSSIVHFWRCIFRQPDMLLITIHSIKCHSLTFQKLSSWS